MVERRASGGGWGRGRRRLWGVLGLAGGLLVGAYTGAWWFVTGRLEAAVPGVMAAAAGEGWRIEGGTPARSGWPWRAAVVVRDVVATSRVVGVDVEVLMPRVEVAVSVIDPWHASVEAPEHAVVRVQGIAGLEGPVRLDWRVGQAVARLDGTGPVRVSARGIEAVGERGVRVRAASLDLAFSGVEMEGAVGGVMPPESMAGPFDVPADVAWRGSVTPGFGMDGAEAARRWQAAGGRVEVAAFSVIWGPLEARGAGHGGLDAALRPMGEGEVAVRGLGPLVAAAGKAGWVPEATARAASAVVGLLSISAHGGAIRVPVTLGGGVVGVAGFPLVRVPGGGG